MSVASSIVADERSRARLRGLDRDKQGDGAPVEPRGDIPVLEPRADGIAPRFAAALGARHPVTVFLVAALAGYALLVLLTVALGLMLTRGVLEIGAVASADERSVGWIAAHRSPSLTEASVIGSIISGGVVIPTLVGLVALTLAFTRRWRAAAFVVAAITVEAATYRGATFFVPRERPDVLRLEDLPVNASYPSGHTAAAVAVYCGLALLLTSRFRSTWFRATCWTLAIAIPPVVALARMYRGMHHPLDAVAGGIMGVGALVVALFAARAAGVAAARRAERNRSRA